MEKNELICKYSESKKLYYLSVWEFEREAFREVARGKYRWRRDEKGFQIWQIGNASNDCAAYCIDAQNRLQSTPLGCRNILWRTNGKKAGFLYEISGIYFLKNFDKEESEQLGAYDPKRGVYIDKVSEEEYYVSIATFPEVERFPYHQPYEVHGNVIILPRDDGFFDLAENGCRVIYLPEKVVKTSDFSAKIFHWDEKKECYQMVRDGRYIGH